ncbi:unnamed protein product, partial [Meganyctiphanes norvegica]
VQFLARLEKTPSETHQLLKTAYQDDALRKATTRTFHKRFQILGMEVYNDSPKKRKTKTKCRRISRASSPNCDYDSKSYENIEKCEILKNTTYMPDTIQNNSSVSDSDNENYITDIKNVTSIQHSPEHLTDLKSNHLQYNESLTNNFKLEVQPEIGIVSPCNHNESRKNNHNDNSTKKSTSMDGNGLYVNLFGEAWRVKSYNSY